MSMPLSNRFHTRQAKSEKITTFYGSTHPSSILTYTSLVAYRRSGLGLLKSTFHDENFILRLSWSISSHFVAIHSWNACRSPKIAKNLLKPLILAVQDHSRSSTLTFLRSSSPVLVMISSMSVFICNHFHARQANSSKITSFRGCPSFAPC